MQTQTIYSNFAHLRSHVDGIQTGRYVFLDEASNSYSAWRIARQATSNDIVILNIDHKRLFALCLLRALGLTKNFKLVSVDILMRNPLSYQARISASMKRVLLKQVDQFLLYFKDIDGLQKYFGIDPSRVNYVPFKVNAWESGLADLESNTLPGSYVLCAGQTLRDVRTFVEAVRISGVPAIMLSPGRDVMQRHGTHWKPNELPPNLRIEYHTDGRHETFLKWIREAAAVVIPRFSTDITSTGISTYLCAMAAHRCVILSKGPGAEDVLCDGQAILVEPENCQQLASALKAAWDDPDLRQRLGAKGRAYAKTLQGESRLMRDILAASLGRYSPDDAQSMCQSVPMLALNETLARNVESQTSIEA